MQKSIQTGFDKVYCYPNTHVLKNKLNIHDTKRLQEAERKITSINIHELEETNDTPKTFNAKHLKAIHKHIFQDIYDWAGEFRTVDIAKGNMFCRVMFIEDQLNYVFRQLHKENCLKNITDTTQMGERLSYYLSEINAIHPFREGNGRTQRIFIKQLAKQAGYNLDYSKIPEGELLKASIQSFNCDYTHMQELITQALTPIPKSSYKTHIEQTKETKTNHTVQDKIDMQLKLYEKMHEENHKKHPNKSSQQRKFENNIVSSTYGKTNPDDELDGPK